MYILHFIFESKIYIYTIKLLRLANLFTSTIFVHLNQFVRIFTVRVIIHTLLILKCWLLKYVPPVYQCVCFVHQAAVGQLVEGNGVVSEVIITLWNPSLKLQLTNFCCIYVCKSRWALTQGWKKLPFTGRAFGMTRYVATWCLKI